MVAARKPTASAKKRQAIPAIADPTALRDLHAWHELGLTQVNDTGRANLRYSTERDAANARVLELEANIKVLQREVDLSRVANASMARAVGVDSTCAACGHAKVFHGIGRGDGVPVGRGYCDDRHADPCGCTGYVEGAFPEKKLHDHPVRLATPAAEAEARAKWGDGDGSMPGRIDVGAALRRVESDDCSDEGPQPPKEIDMLRDEVQRLRRELATAYRVASSLAEDCARYVGGA